MSPTLAIVPAIELSEEIQEAFAEKSQDIKRLITGVEQVLSTKEALQTVDCIVQAFATLPHSDRRMIHFRYETSKKIWALLGEMSAIKSHDEALTELRKIHREYHAFVKAVTA